MSLPVLPPVIESELGNGNQPRNYNSNYIFYWNNVALDLNRLAHTNGGNQTGPPLSARFLGIFHLAMHDAYFAVFPYSKQSHRNTNFTKDFKPYLPQAELAPKRPSTLSGNAAEAKEAVAGAAITVLNKLFKNPDKKDGGVSQKTSVALSDFIDSSVRTYRQAHRVTLHSPAYIFGVEVAKLILERLEIKAGEDGVDAGGYAPHADQPYWFDDDPSHPIRPQAIDPNDPEDGDRVTRPYHAPYYGRTATIFATTEDMKIADPPLVPSQPPPVPSTEHTKYLESLEDVHRMGGSEELATTKRRPAQTARGLFWAYDGVGLIGTPPRLYNQIVKQIAFDKKIDTKDSDLNSDENNAEFIRLLALVNVAMADAGIFCWREKYKYELWRPLTGVRADPTGPVPDGHSRPTWKVLGAPATNSNQGGFKPPFPAYPSGHATFGAAAFQMVRLFYHQRGDALLENIKPAITKSEASAWKASESLEDPNSEITKRQDDATPTNVDAQNNDPPGAGSPDLRSDDARLEGFVSVRNPTSMQQSPVLEANPKTRVPEVSAEEESNPAQNAASGAKVDKRSANDKISFTFISDELNGISRTLSQTYNASVPLQNQAGDVRTCLPITYPSLKEAIFSNAMSRIWLGVHWHFDGFAGETVFEEYKGSDGKDNSFPRPDDSPSRGYKQKYKVEKDGSTKYQKVNEMDWFAEVSLGPRSGSGQDKKFPVGGVPLGIMIADNIFGSGMDSTLAWDRRGDVLGLGS